MTRTTWMLAAACALAACGAGEGDGARPAAPAAGAAQAMAPAGHADSAVADTFAFVLHTTPEGVADSIFVMRGGRRMQTLVPSELLGPGFDSHAYRPDLDFDGHRDYAFLTFVPAAPNPSYDFWRYDPAADRFRYVGNHPMLHPLEDERVLFTHARGGHAGRLWSDSRWRLVNDRVVEIWRGEQTFLDDVQRYARIEYAPRDGRMVVVSADTLEDSELEPAWPAPPGRAAPDSASGVQGPPRS